MILFYMTRQNNVQVLDNQDGFLFRYLGRGLQHHMRLNWRSHVLGLPPSKILTFGEPTVTLLPYSF